MNYLIEGLLIVVFGLLLEYNGHFFIGTTVFIIGVWLELKGYRQVYSNKPGA